MRGGTNLIGGVGEKQGSYQEDSKGPNTGVYSTEESLYGRSRVAKFKSGDMSHQNIVAAALRTFRSKPITVVSKNKSSLQKMRDAPVP